MSNFVLPAVVIAGGAGLEGLKTSLERTGKFPKVFRLESASALQQFASSDDAPSGQLVYVFHPSFVVDYDGFTIESIMDVIKSDGHVVMVAAVGEGVALAGSSGFPQLVPGKPLDVTIASAVGKDITAPVAPAAQELRPRSQDSALWRDARSSRDNHGATVVQAPEAAEEVWSAAVDHNRSKGLMEVGGKRRGYIIATAALKGGVGKTTLSINNAAFLAAQLAAEHQREQAAGRMTSPQRVVVVDMNIQQSDIGQYLHKSEPNVLNVLRNSSLLTEDRIEDALVYSEQYGFHAFLGPHKLQEGAVTQNVMETYRQVISLLQQKFDYIIVDTPVAEKYNPILNFILPKANFIIVPAPPAIVSLTNIKNWLGDLTTPKHLNGYGIAPEKIGLVLNRAKIGIGLDPKDVNDRFSEWNFIGMFPDSDEWQLAENTGKLIGGNPPADLAVVFQHALYKATGDPALNPERVKIAQKFKEPTTQPVQGGFLGKIKSSFLKF